MTNANPTAGDNLDLIADLDLEGMLQEAVAISRTAGALVLSYFDTAPDEAHKGHAHNLVTEADRASEALIVPALAARFPDHRVRAEEGGSFDGGAAANLAAGRAGADDDEIEASGHTRHPQIEWVVDPLDGTNNFAHGLPIFSVSMAAMAGSKVLVGVTFDPTRDELFTATRGGGAFLNGRRLQVSRRPELAKSIIATGFPYDKGSNPHNNLPQFSMVTPKVRGIRRLGSAALDLAYVAAGRMEAYWERGTQAWDVAAGVLMVEEAGGRVTDYDGRKAHVDGGCFVASNGLVHEALRELLLSAGPVPGSAANPAFHDLTDPKG
jgi:myo-inositol-1(or 4)-monophosphatase